MEAVVLFGAVFSAGIGVMSAPSDQLSACVTITEEDTMSMATCCDYALPFTNETVTKCKNKEESGEMKKEYECITDCLFSSDGLMTDQKFDKDKWKSNVEKTVSEDWKDIITESPKKCDEFEKILGPQMPKQCPTSGSDMVFNCMTIRWYLHCPKSAWTSNRACDDSREKFSKCYEFLFPK